LSQNPRFHTTTIKEVFWVVGTEIVKLYRCFVVIKFDRSLIKNFNTCDQWALSYWSLLPCISILGTW